MDHQSIEKRIVLSSEPIKISNEDAIEYLVEWLKDDVLPISKITWNC